MAKRAKNPGSRTTPALSLVGRDEIRSKLVATLKRRTKRVGKCLIWQGAKAGGGYGTISVQHRGDKIVISSNRAAWIVFKGPIPKDTFVCHACDNRACCEPKHLFLGTQKANIVDCAKKGRIKSAKLTAEQARFIFTSAMTQRTLAEMHGLTMDSVNLLKRRKTYAWATEGLTRGMFR